MIMVRAYLLVDEQGPVGDVVRIDRKRLAPPHAGGRQDGNVCVKERGGEELLLADHPGDHRRLDGLDLLLVVADVRHAEGGRLGEHPVVHQVGEDRLEGPEHMLGGPAMSPLLHDRELHLLEVAPGDRGDRRVQYRRPHPVQHRLQQDGVAGDLLRVAEGVGFSVELCLAVAGVRPHVLVPGDLLAQGDGGLPRSPGAVERIDE